MIHAHDTWLDRDIAIKILDPLMALEESQRKRFQHEARVLARLSHPNIPAIYDVILSEAGQTAPTPAASGRSRPPAHSSSGD